MPTRVLFCAASQPRLLAAGPLQVVGDLRSRRFELSRPVVIERLTPHREGITVVLARGASESDASWLATELTQRYPDVNFVVRWPPG